MYELGETKYYLVLSACAIFWQLMNVGFVGVIFCSSSLLAGIVIAMLAMLTPLGVVAAAVFVAGMMVGADGMSRAVGVPTAIADVIVAVALLATLVATMAAQYRLRRT